MSLYRGNFLPIIEFPDKFRRKQLDCQIKYKYSNIDKLITVFFLSKWFRTTGSDDDPLFLIVESFRILCKQSSLGFEFDKGSRGF